MSKTELSITQLGKETEDYLISRLPTDLRKDTDKRDSFLMNLNSYLLKEPKLQKLIEGSDKSIASVIDAAGLAFTYGLPLGIHSHILPFKDQAKFVIDYRGVIEIWRRQPDHNVSMPEPVYENDIFDIQKGIIAGGNGWNLIHKPCLDDDRGELKGMYICWSYKGNMDYLYMSRKDLDAVEREATAKFKGADSPWTTHRLQMWKKTLVKRAAVYGNTSPEVLNHYNEYDSGDKTKSVKSIKTAKAEKALSVEKEITLEKIDDAIEVQPVKEKPKKQTSEPVVRRVVKKSVAKAEPIKETKLENLDEDDEDDEEL